MRLRWNQWKDVSQGSTGPGGLVTALPWTHQRIANFVVDPGGGIFNTAGTLYRWGPWASVSEGSTVPGGLVAAVPFGQRVALFVADRGGGIYTAAGSPDTGYGPWASVSEGSTTPGGAVAAVPYGRRIALFVADRGGGVYTTAGSPDADWGPWASVSEGSTMPGAPVTALPFGQRIALFVADRGGGVYTTAGTPDAGWGPWANVSGGSTTPGAPVTAVPSGDRISLFLADPAGGVYTTTGSPDSGWGPWTSVSQGVSVPGGRVAVIPLPWDAHRYAVFITDGQGGIHWTSGAGAAGWQPWTEIPRALVGPQPGSPLTPVIGYRQPQDLVTLALLVARSDGQIAYTSAEPPLAPTSLRVTDVSAHRIDLAWSARARDADGFRIRFTGTRAGVADHTGSRSFDGDARSASLTDLLSGYAYTIEIVAFNVVGESAVPDPVTATVPNVPETIQVILLRQQVIEGLVPLFGQYPPFGQVPAGHLLNITLPADSGVVVGLNLVKKGHSSGDCNNPDAVVTLGRGKTTTEAEMTAIYGVAKPLYTSALPVPVLACALTAPTAPLVNQVTVHLTIISDGP